MFTRPSRLLDLVAVHQPVAFEPLQGRVNLADVHRRPDERGARHELFREVDRLGPFVGIEAEHEIALQIRDLLVELTKMLHHGLELGGASREADSSLVRVVGPGLDPRRDGDAVGCLQSAHAGSSERRERAFHDIGIPAVRTNSLQDVEDSIEFDAEIRIVEPDQRSG